ncbi:MAG: hypothetical protein ACE5KM_01240 [Planctomycetaceae bacterium]
MLDNPLVTVMAFGTPQEAAIAQGFLDNHGISSHVQGAEIAATLFYVGTALGGVKLQVASSQVEKARRLLDEEFDTTRVTGPWTCPRCREQVDAGYEVCWSCGTVMGDDVVQEPVVHEDEHDDRKVSAEPADGPSEIEPTADGNTPEREADAVLNRAWKAMVFGVLLCPFQFYALYLLISIPSQDLSRKARRRFWTMYAIILAYLAVVVIVFFSCVSPLFRSDRDPHPDWEPLKPVEQRIEFDF